MQGTIDDLLLRAIHSHNEGNLEEAVVIYSKILDSVSENDKNVIIEKPIMFFLFYF